MPGDGFWAPFKIITQNTSSMNLSVLLWNFSCMLKIVQNKPLHQWLISVSDTIFANLNFSFDDKKAITCSSIRCHSCTQLISAECDSQGRFNLSYLFLKSWDKEKLLTHFFFAFFRVSYRSYSGTGWHLCFSLDPSSFAGCFKAKL